jgi:hypothetical protein
MESLYFQPAPNLNISMKTLTALSLFVLSCILFSCHKNEAKPVLTLSDSTPQQGSLQVSNTSITLAGTTVTDTITVNTSLSWKATASASWIHLDTTHGAGVYQLKISADTNKTGNTLTGSVTLTPLNNDTVQPITVNVKQNAFYAILNFAPLTGKIGTNVTLNGYFPANFTVTMNNSSAATIVSHTATQVVFTVPADATAGGYIFINIPGAPLPVVSTQQFTVLSDWKKLSDSTAGLSTNNQPSLIYTYNGSLYYGWGNTNSHTIYRLDTTNYHWVAAITIPPSVDVVQIPTYFIIGSKLYIGGGYSTTALSFYEYDMTQGNIPSAWRELTSLPENMLNGSGFAVGGSGYVQTGELTSEGNNLLYQFSTTGSTDPGSWTTLGPLNVKDGPAASFVIGNTAYFGGGTATAIDNPLPNTFYSMTPPSITLTPISQIPEPPSLGPGQRFCTWTVGNIAYAYDSYSLTLFSYDPSGDSWTKISTIPTTSAVEYAAWYNGHVYAWDNTGAVWEYTGQ